MSFITLKNVYKRYHMGDVTINASNGVNFSVDKGEFTVIVGPSGSGKTTVLNILGGMDTCDEGEIVVGDRVVSELNKKQLVDYRRNDIGFVFQFYNLIQNLTAIENVEMSSQLCKNSVDASEILGRVGLSNRMNNFPAQLSGGEQQRVAIARALAKKPKLLLCDEPTGALDYSTGKLVLNQLHKFCREENMTVILVTHNLALTPMADKVIRLRNGAVDSIETNNNPTPIELIEW